MARDAHRLELAADLDLDLVALARTGPGPFTVTAELPAAWIAGILAHTDAEVVGPGRVSLEVTLIGSGVSVLVRGDLEAGFTVPCARCHEPAPVLATGELCAHSVRGSGGDELHDEEDGDLAPEDAEGPDERSFLGTRLDLRPMIEEQILVAYPIRALCARGEACRGLCMHCGANLNEQPPASRCAVCGTPGARVPVVPAPGEEDAAAPGRPVKPPPDAVGLAGATLEPPWKAALRGLAIDDPSHDDHAAGDNDTKHGAPPGNNGRKPGKKPLPS